MVKNKKILALYGPAPSVRNSSKKAKKYLSGNVARIDTTVYDNDNDYNTKDFIESNLTGGKTVNIFSIQHFTKKFIDNIKLKAQNNEI